LGALSWGEKKSSHQVYEEEKGIRKLIIELRLKIQEKLPMPCRRGKETKQHEQSDLKGEQNTHDEQASEQRRETRNHCPVWLKPFKKELNAPSSQLTRKKALLKEIVIEQTCKVSSRFH